MGFDKEATCSSHTLAIPAGLESGAAATSSSPLLTKSPAHPLSSQPKTFANVFIAIVGAGVLGLPYTFKRTGWVAGTLMLLGVAALTYHCLMLLVRTRRRLESALGFSNIASFGDLGFAVSGPLGRLAVDVMIVMSQAGFCVGYLIFIANTLSHMYSSGDGAIALSASPLRSFVRIEPKALYIWAMFPFQLGLNSVRTLTHLAPLSIFADVVDLGAIGIVMVEDVSVCLKQQPALNAFTSVSVVFYGIGVAVYAFEGAGMVLPLESEAADKKKFGSTLGLSMFLITLMYGLFGVLGYFAFGEETKEIITTNLGHGLLIDLVQIGLCVTLFFTFPVMMNPVCEVAERRFADKQYSLGLRWAVVLAVVLVALSVPNFADFLSLVGSSVCIVLGFVLPALFHMKVFKEEMGLWWLAADVGVLVIGLVLAVSGTLSSLMEIFSVKA